jgi:hypothetical protein
VSEIRNESTLRRIFRRTAQIKRHGGLPECSTADCHLTAFYEADIYDGESDSPVVAPYCLLCATTLHNGGETVRHLDLERQR